MLGLFAKKAGMTQIFDEEGNLTAVTVIKVDPNIVISQKTKEKDGYEAVVVGVDDKKKNRILKPYAGQFPETIAPKKRLKELRDFEKQVAVGDSLGLEVLDGTRYVDVSSVSKGKGFQGVMKRYGFSGGRKSHGSKFHREPGSTGQSTYPGKSFKNIKLPGRMGREKVTVLSLRVVRMDLDKQLIMVRGSVPGINKGLVLVRAAVKK
ncbi:MAG: 50S ribosomal protein L3 [Treponema sp.]|jgi:large subunit ribosomal protein L3|nr:50S ribosomal protein L3 [Treponema sp.]